MEYLFLDWLQHFCKLFNCKAEVRYHKKSQIAARANSLL